MRYIKKYNEGIFDRFKRKSVDEKNILLKEKRANILNKLEEYFKSEQSISVKSSSEEGYIKYNKNIDKCVVKVKIYIDIVNDDFKITIDIFGDGGNYSETIIIKASEDVDKVIHIVKLKIKKLEPDILKYVEKVSRSKEKYELKLKKIDDYTNNFFNVEFPIDDLKDLLLDINDLLSSTPVITKFKDPHIAVIGYTIRWEIDYNPLKIPILKSDYTSNMDVDKITNHYNTIKEYFPLLKELGNRVKSEFGLDVKYYFTNKKEDVYKYLDLSIITGKPDDLLVTKVPYGWE